MNKQYAFSLIELMFVLALIAILILLSSPYLRQVLVRNRIERSVLQLLQAVNLGRRMAIDSNETVVLCPSQDGVACAGSWSDGQILFFNNLEPAADQEETLIRHWRRLNQGVEIVWNGFVSKNRLTFEPLGRGQAMSGSFFICWKGTEQQFNRAIIINRNGRARVSEYDSQGKLVRC